MDLKRNLDNIQVAADDADFVISYLHQHHWDHDWQKTPSWVKEFAHRCIDAGADAFVCHGVPIMHGIEIYKRRPIFYSLGNFIFHIPTPSNYQDFKIWQSVVAVSSFNKGELMSMKLFPITLGGGKMLTDGDYGHRTVPFMAHNKYGVNILKQLSEQSKPFGTKIEIVNDHGEIRE